MKKNIFFILLLAMVGTSGYAQKEFSPEWNFGVGFGPTFSSMSIVPTNPVHNFKTQSILQFQGGLSARYITEKNLGVIAELNFAQQGWETKFPEELSANKHQHKLNYLEIPFMTHIYFGDKTRIFVNLGPQISFLLSDKETMNDDLKNWIATADSTTMATYSMAAYGRKAQTRIDYGLIGGLGLEFRTGIGNFALEGRYYMGFGDIYKNAKRDDYSRSANRVISAKLTYYIKPF